MKVNKIIKYISNKHYRFLVNAASGKYDKMPDKEYLERKFEAILGRKLDIENPKTLNEKLQWLKLYDRKPEYSLYVDKFRVKEYVAKIIGEKYIIPTLFSWDNVEDIDFSILPNQFVLKCNHNSGLGMCICDDKSKLLFDSVKANLQKGYNENYFLKGREWPYKEIEKKIICEKYMEDKAKGELIDYKFQCFNGKFDSVFVCTGRFSEQGVRYYYFDRNWDYLPYSSYQNINYAQLSLLCPKNLDTMIEIAEKLSEGMCESRVDLYEINGKVYFGEITLFSQSGFDVDITYKADLEMGEKIILPQKINGTEFSK